MDFIRRNLSAENSSLSVPMRDMEALAPGNVSPSAKKKAEVHGNGSVVSPPRGRPICAENSRGSLSALGVIAGAY